MCSEISPPRISFSHDLGQADHGVPIELNMSETESSLLGSNSDFEFSISSSFEHESCSADEIFSNGVLLPIHVKEKFVVEKEIHSLKPPPIALLPPLPRENSSKKEVIVINSDSEQKHVSKSFWGFKKSTSLNSNSKRSLLSSLPLLSRSNSTSSVPSPRQTTLKDVQKHNSQKQASISLPRSSSSSTSSKMQQKPPLKKSYGGSLNAVRISPVLNIPTPYISKRTQNFFHLGSFLRDGKDEKSKK